MDDAYSTQATVPLTVPAPGVLGNDTGSTQADPLTATLVTGPSGGSTVTLNGDGSFTCTPANGVTGDVTFTYQASNSTGTSNVATVTITVTPVPFATSCNGLTPTITSGAGIVNGTRTFAFGYAPVGWAQCNGQLLAISSNPALTR